MQQYLASAVNILGARFASAFATNFRRIFTVRGYLITSASDTFVDSSTNRIIYVQR